MSNINWTYVGISSLAQFLEDILMREWKESWIDGWWYVGLPSTIAVTILFMYWGEDILGALGYSVFGGIPGGFLAIVVMHFAGWGGF